MELISREEAINTIPKIIMKPPRNGKTLWAELIDKWHKNMAELPTIESRPKGKWALNMALAECSNCGKYKPQLWVVNYCPNCGADMRGEE